MDKLTKYYITLYKLKKCTMAQIKGINATAIIIIFLLLAANVFQQIYYPRQIEENRNQYRNQLNHLQATFGNITNSFEDLKAKVEDYGGEDWHTNIKEVRLLMESLEDKINYYESSIFNYFTPSRMKRQKILF